MYEIKKPKDIQEGTANHLMMLLNCLETGNVREAQYSAIDLLDQIVCRALVVTKRVEPMDHAAVESLRKEAYEQGLAEGKRLGHEQARKELRAKLAQVI